MIKWYDSFYAHTLYAQERDSCSRRQLGRNMVRGRSDPKTVTFVTVVYVLGIAYLCASLLTSQDQVNNWLARLSIRAALVAVILLVIGSSLKHRR